MTPKFVLTISSIEPRPLYRAVRESVKISTQSPGPGNRCQEWGAPRVPILAVSGGDQPWGGLPGKDNPHPSWTEDTMSKVKSGALKRVRLLPGVHEKEQKAPGGAGENQGPPGEDVLGSGGMMPLMTPLPRGPRTTSCTDKQRQGEPKDENSVPPMKIRKTLPVTQDQTVTMKPMDPKEETHVEVKNPPVNQINQSNPTLTPETTVDSNISMEKSVANGGALATTIVDVGNGIVATKPEANPVKHERLFVFGSVDIREKWKSNPPVTKEKEKRTVRPGVRKLKNSNKSSLSSRMGGWLASKGTGLRDNPKCAKDGPVPGADVTPPLPQWP